ncbi:MAG: class I SAM-dependent methyltransferase [Acidobacteria bacterium]|nr:class I SAM-dependent methyltransferase [Acidobacteriota bacterium]MBI3657595.1 class I SAM-dependent methyltransferase [Acidobacteriota bacterium]
MVRDTYRERMYERYVTTHTSVLYDLSCEAFKRQQAAFESYMESHLPEDKWAKILDVGCGAGAFLHYLHEKGYANATGIDISPEQVAMAQKLGIKNVECAEVMEYLEDSPNRFDVVTALDVLEHFKKEEVIPLLEAIRASLRSGGVIILQTPNADGPFGSRYRYADFSHEVVFTRTSISQVLAMAGFRRIAVYPTGPVCHGILSAVRWILWQVIKTLLRAYLAVETGSFRGHILTQDLLAVAVKE